MEQRCGAVTVRRWLLNLETVPAPAGIFTHE